MSTAFRALAAPCAALLSAALCVTSVPAQEPAAPSADPPANVQPDAAKPEEPKKVPMSFTGAPLAQVAKFLTDQLGKPVIVSDAVQNVKVTLLNPEPLPLEDALYILRTALHENGVALEERARTIHLIPIAQIAQRQIRVLPPDADLAQVDPPNQIVRKIFELKQYDPVQLLEVLKPLMPSYGHVTADPATGKLIVVATAEDLMSIATVIRQLDRPDVSGRELRVFELEHIDVYELVPLLEKLVSGYLGIEVKAATSAAGLAQPTAPGPQPPGAPPGGPPGAAPAPSGPGILAIQAEKRPVLLIPDPRRSAVIVEAPPHVMAQIETWLVDLDQPKPPQTQTEFVEVRYGDAQDLASQLNAMLNSIPDEGLRSALRIYPFPASRRLMLVGSAENRELLKKWLGEIDTPDTGLRVTRTFKLQYADAQQVAENIKEIFQESGLQRFIYYGPRDTESDRTKVAVTANVRANSVTVLASPERMERIARQIEEWDKPFEGDEAAPRIFTLKYADPEVAKELLESLFTKQERSSQPWWWYDDYQSDTPSPVGRLHGQFRFEAYPEMGKLIVVSKNEENYRVIEEMIAQLDQPQLAGLPRVIELKFADAETLAEQLNALLNAPGTPTSILRRAMPGGGFKELRDEGSPYTAQTQQPMQPNQPEQNAELQVMRFWWQNPPPDIKSKPPSNLVGKMRIVPNVEQNLLLVAAPEEYADAIQAFVNRLDRPGHQVLIKAVIAEAALDDSMSLGYRFSTDPSVFTSGDTLITDNAIRGLLSYTFEDTFGQQNTIALDVDVNNLLSLLRRVTDLKIRSEPKILTADNVEGEFFDGQDIPFIDNVLTTQEGGSNQSFSYFPVGITLRVRPHITQEENIDLLVNLRISSVIPGNTLFGGAIVDRRETSTRVVLENGKTFMISGILREEQRRITRRIPGLGDIPLLGELFKHRETADVNSELLIFLTPYVIGPKYRHVIEGEPLQRMWDSLAPQDGREPTAPPEAPPTPPPADDAEEPMAAAEAATARR